MELHLANLNKTDTALLRAKHFIDGIHEARGGEPLAEDECVIVVKTLALSHFEQALNHALAARPDLVQVAPGLKPVKEEDEKTSDGCSTVPIESRCFR